ncbi:MAG: hypothetical protein JKY34_10100 [Kordiimonadaceae bacterium]|nr:hypothetical protein [Kordiimonadaceae bacterium]
MKLSESEYRDVTQFIYKEARFADNSLYSEWEELLNDDFEYMVPIEHGESDPTKRLLILFDNRARAASRVRMLKTGVRHTQTPPSPMARVISNIEVEKIAEGEYRVYAAFMLGELQVQAHPNKHIWVGRYEYLLKEVEGTLGMSLKKVFLIDSAHKIPALGFLI